MIEEILKVIESSPASSSEVDFTGVYELVSPNDIQLLAKRCPDLESLIFQLCEDEALEYLFLFPKLRKLSIKSAEILSTDEKWLESICSLPQLTHLTIKSYQSLDRSFLEKISFLQQLVYINFEFCDHVMDENLHIFSQFPYLRFLNLNGSDYLTDDGIGDLASLTKLEGFELAYTRFTDKGFQQLSSLTQIKYLDIRRVQISDEGLRFLSSFDKLELLNLNQCPHLTDKGFLYLKKLPKLRLICIGNASQITEQAIQQMPSSVQVIRTTDREVWELWNSLIKEYN